MAVEKKPARCPSCLARLKPAKGFRVDTNNQMLGVQVAEAKLKTLIKNRVRNAQSQRLTITELKKLITAVHPDVTRDQIVAQIDEMVAIDKKLALSKRKRRYNVARAKGGRSVYSTAGTERTRTGTGPYRTILETIEGESQAIGAIFGAPFLHAHDVHAGRTSRGRWTRPDIIVELYHKDSKARAFEIHAIEFEGPGGFSPANVAQASFAGHGADRAWLVFAASDWPRNVAERAANPSAVKIRDFAMRLGVGLITYRDLSRAATWHRILPAKKMRRDQEDRGYLRAFY